MAGDTWDISDLPDDVAVKVADLGAAVAEFAAGGRRFFLQLLAAPVIFLIGLVLAGGSLFVILRFGGHGAGAGLFKLAFLGCVLILGALVLSVRAYRNRGLRVLVFPEGLVRLHGDQVNAFFWEEVERVGRRKNTGVWGNLARGALVFTVRRANGEEFTFDDQLGDVKRLGEMIQRETLPYLLPRALAVYEAGESVNFEKVRVSQRGVGNGTETIPWSEIKSIDINEQTLTIRKAGKWTTWLSATVGDIPNIHVFEALVRPVAGVRLTSALKAK